MPLPTNIAIFSIDPGGTTGCACGVFDLRRITVKAIVGRAKAKQNLKTWNVKGTNVAQNWEISKAVVDFYYTVHVEKAWIMYNKFYVVTENFNLREMGADLAPVERNSGIETLLEPCFKDRWDEVWSKQTASQAKGFCDDKMLDRWGLLKGKSPHERDATRHIASRLDILLKTL
jgi:hypothetical protein